MLNSQHTPLATNIQSIQTCISLPELDTERETECFQVYDNVLHLYNKHYIFKMNFPNVIECSLYS